MSTFYKKIAIGVSAVALSAFVGGMFAPATAEAGIGLKIPKIKLPTASNQQGSNNSNNTGNNTSQAPKSNTISGRVTYNNTNGYKPAAGFDVYLLHGNSFPQRDSKDYSILRVDGPHMKIATTDANGNYSAPIPSNINSFATNGRFPDVKLLFFKPGTGNYDEKRSLNYLGKFTETNSVSHWEHTTYPTRIVFTD